MSTISLVWERLGKCGTAVGATLSKYRAQWTILSYSLPAQNAAKRVSSHATGFTGYSKCLRENLLQYTLAYNRPLYRPTCMLILCYANIAKKNKK